MGVVLFVASLTVGMLDQKHVWHNAPAGLLERLTIILAWSWLSLLSLRALRSQSSSHPEHDRLRETTSTW